MASLSTVAHFSDYKSGDSFSGHIFRLCWPGGVWISWHPVKDMPGAFLTHAWVSIGGIGGHHLELGAAGLVSCVQFDAPVAEMMGGSM